MDIIKKIKQIFENTNNPELAAHQILTILPFEEIKDYKVPNIVEGKEGFEKLIKKVEKWKKEIQIS